MNLRDVIENLSKYTDTLAIYAAPRWEPSSRALVVAEPDDGSLPRTASGLTYFMEVSQAREVADVWRRCRPGVEPSANDLCEAMLYYARHDAHEPVFEDAV